MDLRELVTYAPSLCDPAGWTVHGAFADRMSWNIDENRKWIRRQYYHNIIILCILYPMSHNDFAFRLAIFDLPYLMEGYS